MRTQRSIILLGAVASTLALTACGGDDEQAKPAGQAAKPAAAVPEPGAGAGDAVFIKTFIFRPDPMTVKTGTKVTFRNLDGTIHTVTAGTRAKPDPGQFDARLDKDGTFEHTFDEAGTYPYFCTLHAGDGMVGEIVVE